MYMYIIVNVHTRVPAHTHTHTIHYSSNTDGALTYINFVSMLLTAELYLSHHRYLSCIYMYNVMLVPIYPSLCP